jgi:hypothetical protein
METEDIRFRLERLVDDFEARADKGDGYVPEETVAVVKALLDAAKEAVPDDPIVRAVRIPEKPRYSKLYPTLRQVTLGLPRAPMIA